MFSNKISTFKKIVLSSSRGQGNFRGSKASRPRPRTGGFEAKAKDLKMCPRGRPRGLHLCLFKHRASANRNVNEMKSKSCRTKISLDCYKNYTRFKIESETLLKLKEIVNSSSIPVWVKPKTIKIGIHSFPA